MKTLVIWLGRHKKIRTDAWSLRKSHFDYKFPWHCYSGGDDVDKYGDRDDEYHVDNNDNYGDDGNNSDNDGNEDNDDDDTCLFNIWNFWIIYLVIFT